VQLLLAAAPEAARATDLQGPPTKSLSVAEMIEKKAVADLIGPLLAAFPEGAKRANAEGHIPLHRACVLQDPVAICAVLGAWPEGASVRAIPHQSKATSSASSGRRSTESPFPLPLHLLGGRRRWRDGELDYSASVEIMEAATPNLAHHGLQPLRGAGPHGGAGGHGGFSHGGFSHAETPPQRGRYGYSRGRDGRMMYGRW
jgi:hypothetical protein